MDGKPKNILVKGEERESGLRLPGLRGPSLRQPPFPPLRHILTNAPLGATHYRPPRKHNPQPFGIFKSGTPEHTSHSSRGAKPGGGYSPPDPRKHAPRTSARKPRPRRPAQAHWQMLDVLGVSWLLGCLQLHPPAVHAKNKEATLEMCSPGYRSVVSFPSGGLGLVFGP